MHCASSSLAVLLSLLGTPVGNKAKQDYSSAKELATRIAQIKNAEKI